MDSDSSKPLSRPSLGTRGCYHKAANWDTKGGETLLKNFKVGRIQLHTWCFYNCSPDFQYQNEKKRVIQGGDIDILVSDTVGTQESRIDTETDLYLVHPSGNSWLFVVVVKSVDTIVILILLLSLFLSLVLGLLLLFLLLLLLLLMTSMRSSYEDFNGLSALEKLLKTVMRLF